MEHEILFGPVSAFVVVVIIIVVLQLIAGFDSIFLA